MLLCCSLWLAKIKSVDAISASQNGDLMICFTRMECFQLLSGLNTTWILHYNLFFILPFHFTFSLRTFFKCRVMFLFWWIVYFSKPNKTGIFWKKLAFSAISYPQSYLLTVWQTQFLNVNKQRKKSTKKNNKTNWNVLWNGKSTLHGTLKKLQSCNSRSWNCKVQKW